MNDYGKLKKNLTVDVLIIGGGITGFSVAYHLKNSNLKIALVERGKIGNGITARTTGKITYMQGLYSKIAKIYREEIASFYYESQKDAIKIIKEIIDKNKIECDFTKQTSYLFASNKKEIKMVENEAEFLRKMKEKCFYLII